MNKDLIRTLAECAAACNHCSVACLQEEDIKMMVACIRLDMDCAKICLAAQDYVARDSRYAREILQQCAKICRDCGEECDKHKAEHCKICAEACFRCAEACEQYQRV
ncbi:four-helix bundle copper-binding protein [Pontibacter beigongshangensis]|uniref:four-helix bundle copper-binding protein n=1 Tax=Pontibacter beigongshangensis TaxID=2574733 RepID=UPI00164F802D|nr:four-helix bundle copper-binding protein [Pontibacter beigongshangensis]